MDMVRRARHFEISAPSVKISEGVLDLFFLTELALFLCIWVALCQCGLGGF